MALKKRSSFKMNGMGFGMGAGMPAGMTNPNVRQGQRAQMQQNPLAGRPFMKEDILPEEKQQIISDKRRADKEAATTKTGDFLRDVTRSAEWDEGLSEKGYITKSKTGKNLFGRKRDVIKYFDPETGKKLGKKVTVARGEGDPRADKVKAKIVNPGLTQSGGVGKIRVGADYFGGPGGDTDAPDSSGQFNRQEFAKFVMNKGKGDPNSVTDPVTGQPKPLSDYASEYAKMKTVDGKRMNPRKLKDPKHTGYSTLKEFEDEAEKWWAEQSAKHKNPKLAKQDQPYSKEYTSPNTKKKRGYTMKSAPFKNYKKGYYGVK